MFDYIFFESKYLVVGSLMFQFKLKDSSYQQSYNV